MNNSKSKSIIGVFSLVAVLFFIFLIFSFYTVFNLKDIAEDKQHDNFDDKNAPIAVVEVEGVIMESEKIVHKLHKAESDKGIKAIIVRVNSPGGAVGPTQEIYEEIRRIDKEKPVYASFGTVAASGGYYIGAATRRIYSPSGAMTGSIGVIMNFMDLSKLYELAKVSPETIKSGKYKDIGSPSRSMNEEERSLLTNMTKDVHEQFIQDIFVTREKKIVGGLEGLREYAQGQIFSGAEAKKLGLVDENLGLWQAGRAIHKELKLEGKFALRVIKLKKDKSFMEYLNGMEESAQNLKHVIQGTWMPILMMK